MNESKCAFTGLLCTTFRPLPEHSNHLLFHPNPLGLWFKQIQFSLLFFILQSQFLLFLPQFDKIFASFYSIANSFILIIYNICNKRQMYARIVIVPNFALEAFYNRTYRQLPWNFFCLANNSQIRATIRSIEELLKRVNPLTSFSRCSMAAQSFFKNFSWIYQYAKSFLVNPNLLANNIGRLLLVLILQLLRSLFFASLTHLNKLFCFIY